MSDVVGVPVFGHAEDGANRCYSTEVPWVLRTLVLWHLGTRGLASGVGNSVPERPSVFHLRDNPRPGNVHTPSTANVNAISPKRSKSSPWVLCPYPPFPPWSRELNSCSDILLYPRPCHRTDPYYLCCRGDRSFIPSFAPAGQSDRVTRTAIRLSFGSSSGAAVFDRPSPHFSIALRRYVGIHRDYRFPDQFCDIGCDTIADLTLDLPPKN